MFCFGLIPEKERVLLRKANYFLYAGRGFRSRENKLTNKLIQQLVDLLATAWKDQDTVLEGLGLPWAINNCLPEILLLQRMPQL